MAQGAAGGHETEGQTQPADDESSDIGQSGGTENDAGSTGDQPTPDDHRRIAAHLSSLSLAGGFVA